MVRSKIEIKLLKQRK